MPSLINIFLFFLDAFIKYFGSLGNRNFHTTANITLGIWIHSSLVLTKSGRVSLFLNGQEIAIVQSKVLLSNDSSDGKASVMLGQWITLHEIGKTYGPVIHYDEIAIFYDELTIPFIRKIILKNFGTRFFVVVSFHLLFVFPSSSSHS